MDAMKKQVGMWSITFDPNENTVLVHYVDSPETGTKKTYATGEQAYTDFVRLHMAETVLKWIDDNQPQPAAG